MKNKREHSEVVQRKPSRLRKSLELEKAECKKIRSVLLPSTGQNAYLRWTGMDARVTAGHKPWRTHNRINN